MYAVLILVIGLGLATPLTRAQDNPAAGLVGQTYALCSMRGVPFSATVERADWTAGPGGGMQLTLIVQATNTGDRATDTYLATKVQDERGRVFDFEGQGLNINTVARALGVQPPVTEMPPGLGARTVWAYVVAPDVQTLELIPTPLARC